MPRKPRPSLFYFEQTSEVLLVCAKLCLLDHGFIGLMMMQERFAIRSLMEAAMVTRTFQTDDGAANASASVTVEGMPNRIIRVTIDGEKVEPAAEGRATPVDAAPSTGNGRMGGATAVSVQVTATSTFSGTAASVQVSSSVRGAHSAASGGLFKEPRRNCR